VVKASNKALLKNELKFPYDFSALDDAWIDQLWLVKTLTPFIEAQK
jgi:hypothetical protein